MPKLKLHWQILLALVLGVVAGTVVQGLYGEAAGDTTIVALFNFIGTTVFIGLLKMVIVPLIFSSIVTGITSLGKAEGFGRLGLKTLAYYLTSSALAILIGLTVVNVMKPGLVGGKPNPQVEKFITENQEGFAKSAEDKVKAGLEKKDHKLGAIGRLLESMIPTNVFAAASDNGAMLALIFISLVTAFGLNAIEGQGRDALVNAVVGLNDLMIKVTRWIMKLAAVGVFGLIAYTISKTGPTFLLSMIKYMATVLLALGLHLFVALPLLLALVGKVDPRRHFAAMRDALLTAFSTSSSSATLPVTMRCLQDNAGVSKRTASFVLPLGATVNMDGTALYECVAVLFVAQVMGGALDFGGQLTVVVLALATSIGVAGVPSASLVAIVIILQNVGSEIPGGEAAAMAAVGAILAVDRLLDMSRTAVNIFSDSCGAVIIAKSEGEEVLRGGAK